jgi:hypothetical protein
MDSVQEDINTYNQYNYNSIQINVDKRIDNDDATIQLRVNPYRQQGKLTFRALRLEFKETIRKKNES